MAFATFTPPGGVSFSTGTSESRKPRVLTAGFGDGYVQRTADGRNADLAELNVRFDVLYQSEAETIFQFFRSKGGYIPFKFTLPGEASPRKWIASEFTRVWDGATIVAVAAVWKEVVDPE